MLVQTSLPVNEISVVYINLQLPFIIIIPSITIIIRNRSVPLAAQLAPASVCCGPRYRNKAISLGYLCVMLRGGRLWVHVVGGNIFFEESRPPELMACLGLRQ